LELAFRIAQAFNVPIEEVFQYRVIEKKKKTNKKGEQS